MSSPPWWYSKVPLTVRLSTELHNPLFHTRLIVVPSGTEHGTESYRAGRREAAPMSRAVEATDVLIVGRRPVRHRRRLPPAAASARTSRIAILEARDAIGGTWDLFRYPGVRSDSDMFTLGYSFRPWTDAKAIADGAVDPATTSATPPGSTASTSTSGSTTGWSGATGTATTRAGRSRRSAPTPTRSVTS